MDSAGNAGGRVRIGAVSYLNTLPLVHGMQQGLGAGRVVLDFDVPSTLSERMAAGRLDIALLPVIEMARIPGLELIPGLGIVTRGACRSVQLVCKHPIERVRSVALDPESRTSNALARVLCADVWNVRPAFRDAGPSLEAALGACDAAVRIGDKALFEPPPAGLEVHDLGRVWTAATGLPFVFAAWIARRGVVDAEIREILLESHRLGARAIETIARSYRWDGRRDPELARSYLTENIRFVLDDEAMRALRAFFDAATRLGLIESVPSLAAPPLAGAHLSETRP